MATVIVKMMHQVIQEHHHHHHHHHRLRHRGGGDDARVLELTGEASQRQVKIEDQSVIQCIQLRVEVFSPLINACYDSQRELFYAERRKLNSLVGLVFFHVHCASLQDEAASPCVGHVCKNFCSSWT